MKVMETSTVGNGGMTRVEGEARILVRFAAANDW